MNEDFRLNLAIGTIRGLHAQNLITDEQMNIAVNNLELPIDNDTEKEIAARKPQKEGTESDKSSRIL